MRDITERKHLQDQLSVLEFTDSRTGLSTHRAFDEALEREWNRTLREGSEISLLLLDFDHFRQFHDWRQHREGRSLSGRSCRCRDWCFAHNRFCRALRRRGYCDHSPLYRLWRRGQSGRKGAVCRPGSPLSSCWKWDERRPADGEYGPRDGVGTSRRNRPRCPNFCVSQPTMHCKKPSETESKSHLPVRPLLGKTSATGKP